MVARTVYESSSHYPYTIIPLFIVMGSYAEITGISTDLYDTFDKWLRRLPGGLGMATIASIAGFSAISGSSVASSAAFGKVAYPEMRRFNYSPRLAAGTVAAGATIDFLIPPSLGFVIFGMLTEQSIGKLLISGMIPGLMLAGAFMIILYVWVKFNPNSALSSPEGVSWKEKISALKGIWETVVIFLLVIGGIYTGLFTPTEAAGVGATLIFLMAIWKKKLTATDTPRLTFGSCPGFRDGSLLSGRCKCVQLFFSPLHDPDEGFHMDHRACCFQICHSDHHRPHLPHTWVFLRCHLNDDPDTARYLSCDIATRL